ncbi:MAG: hypothetical protein DRO67_07440 [Candidatus Asgardarchaeum californiense]|nr:MAG: hypothetical protein DRO67_07440 [Candidatus Asgardarchaeum californiense]
MAAAELTPTSVQITYKPSIGSVGTAKRIVEYLAVITKATQADWVVASTYFPGTVINAEGWTIDGSSDGAVETVTYADTGDKILLGSANVGTEYLRVTCLE